MELFEFASNASRILGHDTRLAIPRKVRPSESNPHTFRSVLGDNQLMTGIDPQRGHHDMGGLPAGAVERTEHDYALWEKRVDALMELLAHKDRRLLTADELRRNIESLGSASYDTMTYYERWIYAITQTLIQRGVITVDELGRKIEAVRARERSHD